MNDSQKVNTPHHFRNYLSMVRGLPDARLFMHAYMKTSTGDDVDILQDGELSCAYVVSSVLLIHRMIREVHATVDGTIRDMLAMGWKPVTHPTPGCVLVWEKQRQGKVNKEHTHIGFYLDDESAVSNSTTMKVPKVHDLTFGGTREITGIFIHPSSDFYDDEEE